MDFHCNVTAALQLLLLLLLIILLLLYASFWVIPRRLNFICRHSGTLCLFHLHGWVGVKNNWGWESWGIYMGKRFGSKIAYKIQTLGNYPEESTQHSEHVKSLKSIILLLLLLLLDYTTAMILTINNNSFSIQHWMAVCECCEVQLDFIYNGKKSRLKKKVIPIWIIWPSKTHLAWPVTCLNFTFLSSLLK